jgi:ABC-2 type transport system ATP-binding protein
MSLSIYRSKKMPEPVIVVDQLTRRFGDFVAVNGISFEVQPGEVVGYLGPNGSGKTTTFRMLLGLIAPTAGRASVLGFDVFRESEQVRARVGYMSQKFAIYDDLTVWENIQFYGGVYGITDKARIEETIAIVGLSDHKKTITRELSGGWRQRLALGIALVHSPRLLLLDEPTSGVDPTARRAFWDLIYELAADGVTVLVTTHYMDEAEYCNRVGMMRDGNLLALGTPIALKEQHIHGEVWELYIEPLLDGLQLLAEMQGVVRASLSGDHLRVIVEPGLGAEELKATLELSGVRVASIQKGEPTLEDVFLNLAKGINLPDLVSSQ